MYSFLILLHDVFFHFICIYIRQQERTHGKMNIINHCYIIKSIHVHIISLWNIAIFQISSSKWQCTNENKKHVLLYNQQTGRGRFVHFNIWIHFYPVGDMITGTKAGDGQYARTDYTGECVFNNKKLIWTCMCCGSEDALGFQLFWPIFVCLCLNYRGEAWGFRGGERIVHPLPWAL